MVARHSVLGCADNLDVYNVMKIRLHAMAPTRQGQTECMKAAPQGTAMNQRTTVKVERGWRGDLTDEEKYDSEVLHSSKTF